MPRGGKRTPKEGKALGRPKSKPELPETVKRTVATEVLNSLGKEWKHGKIKEDGKEPRVCDCEICVWRDLILISGDKRLTLEALKYLTDKRDGKAVHTVNHLHDKPIEHTHIHTISERMRIAMEKAELRVSGTINIK